ncbi:hypothetical protein CEUSTIGMA_g4405.t1 [Chlamydomonas eustigma]|uniref:EF-hand domain-containing protein n=1 Tax=Chlamydomonas eustigma TaxID=1157962 RepID=A0A250X1L3_9CHLO|nr:hypothetical protein CEUSTIGMA_g4405.t1 [Chlamydomonas eustigma]|eukprot:GAX76958.1 hypothetical protein CEUSTIGMA_g4405.t1 [Chlamydomonas eustigma]
MDGLMKCASVDLEDHKNVVMMPATYQSRPHLMMMDYSSLNTDQHESNVMGMIHNSALPGSTRSTSIRVGEPADHERQSSHHSTGQLVNTSMSPGSPGQKHAEKAYLPGPASGAADSGSTTTHWEHDNREHGHSTAGIEHVPVGLLPIASFHTLPPSVLLTPPASTTTLPEAAVVAAASISVCSSSSAASTREVQAATPISTVWQDALLSDALEAGPQIQHGIRHLEEQCNYGPAVDHPAHATSTTVDITDDALAGRSLILTSSASSQAVAEITAESSSNSSPRVNQDSKMEACLELSQLRPPLSSSEPKIANDNSSSSHTAAPAATTATATKARVQFLRGDSVVASQNNARFLRASQTLVDRFETLEELRSFIADHDLRAEKQLAQRQQRMRPPYSIIIKILINYLQVIPTVTNAGVVFPTFMTDFFRGASDTSSGTGTAVSLDCSLPSSSLPENLQAVLFYVSLPGVFCILTVPIWALLWLRRSSVNLKPNKVVPEEETNDSGRPDALGKEKEEMTATRGINDDDVQITGSTSRKLLAQNHSSAVGWSAWSSDEVNDTNHDPSVSSFVIKKQTMGGTWKSYFSLRMLITAFSVVFYFYPNVCAAILALFACDRMDLDEPPYSQYAIIRGWYMQSDSNVQCFTGKHLILLYLIGVPGIIFFAVGLPVGSAIYLTLNKAQFESASFSAKYGFLFEDYHRHWYWWETVTLLRKLFTVAVNSSPLQAFSTTLNLLVLLAVVLVALLAQVLCRPYEIPRMNQLESFSLQAISVTIFVYTMISLPNVNYEASTLNALSVLLIILNSAFVAFFVFSLISELHNTAVAVLDKDGDGNVSATEVAEYLKERFGFFAPVPTFFGKLTAAFHRNDSHFNHQVSKASSINAAAASAAYPRLTVSAHHQTASMYSFGSQRLQRNHTSNGRGTNAGNWRVANGGAKQQAIASSTKRFVTDMDPAAAIENDHDPYDGRQPQASSFSNDGPCMSVQGRKSDGTALNIREATVS